MNRLCIHEAHEQLLHLLTRINFDESHTNDILFDIYLMIDR